jgi:hypothetical protein
MQLEALYDLFPPLRIPAVVQIMVTSLGRRFESCHSARGVAQLVRAKEPKG